MKGTTSHAPGFLRLVVILLIGIGFHIPVLANASSSLDADFTCPGEVNVKLQDGCQAELQVKNLLLGDQTGVDLTQYILTVKDILPENGAIVDGCGTYEYVISGPDNFGCWGLVTAEDKTPPELFCPEDVSGYYEGESYYPFFCTDVDTLAIIDVASYTTNSDGEVLEISPELKKILDITGYPKVYENCGDLTIQVSDEVLDPDDACKKTVIRRTFTAYNNSCAAYTASCTQSIFFGQPDFEYVKKPKPTVEIPCTADIELDDKGNPHPIVTGYPTIKSAFGYHTIDNVYCNLGASYVDGERIDFCEGTYKLVRAWQVIDWCTPGKVYEFSQIIKVSDTEGPKVLCETVDYDNDGYNDIQTFSTGPYDCTASFEAPMPIVEDNCSDWTVLTEILAGSFDGPVVATILPGKSRYVSGIPLGCHVMRYTVIDGCGNKTIKYCPFLVEDQVAPIAVCDDDLNISLGGQGFARVDATDIDEGSSDNCGSIYVEVRRRIIDIDLYDCLDIFDTDNNGVVLKDEVRLSNEFGDPDGDGIPGDVFYYTPWQEYVEFTCCDMNENVRIELRVWDDRNGNGFPGDTDEVTVCFSNDKTKLVEDNFNVCWLDVLIEDKVAPICTPPAPVNIDCNKLPYDFDPVDEVQMTSLFGEAEGNDNCEGWVVKELDPDTEDINDCGAGSFIRRFEVTDAKGSKSSTCEQVITLNQIHDYWIKFPADAQAQCTDANPDTVMVKEDACDLLAISTKDEFFSASGDECYKIFRTFSVINWCEYDGESDPVVISRDEDCDQYPGDEDVYVIVKTLKEKDPCPDRYGDGYIPDYYQHVWYDRDNDPFNLLPLAGTKGLDCDYETNPFGFWKEIVPITENEDEDADDYEEPGGEDDYPKPSGRKHCEMASVGYWQYTQVIKVYDTENPTVTWNEQDPFCSYSSDFDNGCPAEVIIDFTVEEKCSPDDVTVTIYLDADRDGITDRDITDLLSGSYPNYTIKGSFPLGKHYLGVSVDDGCGNQNGVNIPFEVADCKAPTPICLNGLAIELMPVIPENDVDGDGLIDDGAMTIWASDFIASPAYDCSGEVTYSINRSEGGIPSQDATALTLTCNDPPNTLIQIWAYDEAGNADLCETYVLVQTNMVQCGLTGSGAVAGVVAKENRDAVQDVEVGLSGQQFSGVMTNVEGRYQFDNLGEGFDYTISAYKDEDPLNGVSTFDLVLMSKHILGVQLFDTPYKMIAADINNSGTITTLDVLEVRKLLLNVETKFNNNTSWRFVPSDFVFQNPGNPWKDQFPEVMNINNLQGILADRAFVAIKIGDLNGNAKGNALQGEARNVQGTFNLSLEEQDLVPGEIYEVEFKAAAIADIQGFQGTFNLDKAKVKVIDLIGGIAGLDNFGLRLLDEGFITTSWHQSPAALNGQTELNGEDVLFTLVIQAQTTAKLSEVVGVSNRLTVAEAYDFNDDLLDVALEFGSDIKSAEFALYQNTPNPFRNETQIGFYLPRDGEVSLSVFDASGKMLKLIRADYAAGKNQININSSELAGAGVLYYTLTSGEHTATKKMIIIE